MSELANAVKRKLEAMTCPTHNKKVTVTINGETGNYTPCCEDFGKKCRAAELEAIKEESLKQIKGLFGK